MTSFRPSPVVLERISAPRLAREVTKSDAESDMPKRPPQFRLIDTQKMDNVVKIARRRLNKIKEQQKIEEFLSQQGLDRPAPPVALGRPNVCPTWRNGCPVIVSKLRKKPQIKQLISISDSQNLLGDVTHRIRRLLHQMQRLPTTEETEFKVIDDHKLNKVSNEKRPELHLRFPSSGNERMSTSKGRVTLPTEAPQSKVRVQTPNSSIRNGQPAPTAPGIKLPPYQRRRIAHRHIRPPGNVDVHRKRSQPAAKRSRLPVVELKPFDEAVAEPEDVGSEVPEDSVPVPNDSLRKLWQHLLKIELEDRDVEDNLREIRLNLQDAPASNPADSIVDQSENDFDYSVHEIKPKIKAQPTRERVVGQPGNTAGGLEPEDDHLTRSLRSPSRDEWTAINDVSDEVVRHLMDELSAEFEELPRAILRELLEREFVGQETTTT